jgi:hypothetical protein
MDNEPPTVWKWKRPDGKMVRVEVNRYWDCYVTIGGKPFVSDESRTGSHRSYNSVEQLIHNERQKATELA